MKTLYFDLVSGASGDMILSSLIDIGVPVDWLRRQLAKLRIPGFVINVEKQKRSGISASHLVMKWDTPRDLPPPPGYTWHDQIGGLRRGRVCPVRVGPYAARKSRGKGARHAT